MPYFNTETGAMQDDPSTDVPEASAPAAQPAKTFSQKLAERYGVQSSPAKASAIDDTVMRLDPLAARAELEAMRADTTHPAWDVSHPAHELGEERYLALIMLERGLDPRDPEQNPVIGELFDGGQIRAPGADALSPSPRPNLPEGYAFDEGALVLAEIQAHAMGARPSLIMEITDALAEVIEQTEARGGGWAEADGRAELVRRHGQDGAARLIDNAKVAYQTLLEAEHPLVVQRVRELGEVWGDDPGVITLFGTLIFDALSEGPVTPAKEALILRRTEKQAKAEAAGRARAAHAEREAEAEGDEARAGFMDATAARHARWGKQEP
jgi:hypothetical protein